MDVGFLGLGTMGAPMAGHLMRAGHQVAVWNRTPGKADALVQAGAKLAATLAELAQSVEGIAICVNRTEDLAEVLEALEPHLKPGQWVVDHSTIEPEAARTWHARLRARGVAFIDAPITGGSMGAQKGTLTIFCGGTADDVARVVPVLQAYGKTVEHVGDPGDGQKMKLANQIAVGGALLGLCECLAFARRAGLDVEQAHRLISGGAGGSWAFDNYGPKALADDWTPGFSIKNQRKDFGYCLQAADALGLPLPTTALANALLEELQQAGRGEDATVALYEILREARQGGSRA